MRVADSTSGADVVSVVEGERSAAALAASRDEKSEAPDSFLLQLRTADAGCVLRPRLSHRRRRCRVFRLALYRAFASIRPLTAHVETEVTERSMRITDYRLSARKRGGSCERFFLEGTVVVRNRSHHLRPIIWLGVHRICGRLGEY